MNSARHASRASLSRLLSGGRWGAVFVALVVLSTAALLAAPWPLEVKAMTLLHGLCAQRPSHSYWFGSARLPFDARMSGIYGGFLVTQLYLLGRGRLRAARLPSLPIVAALGLYVAAMALDGTNSLAADLRLPSVYVPVNGLRLTTGALAGTTLGVALWLLVGAAVWSPAAQRRAPVLRDWLDVVALLALDATLCLAVASGWPPLYGPLAIALVVAAVLAVWMVCLAVIGIGRGRGARRLRDLAGPACGALLAAYLVLLGTASFRAILEAGLRLKELP